MEEVENAESNAEPEVALVRAYYNTNRRKAWYQELYNNTTCAADALVDGRWMRRSE
jgi:hypothetical protein